MLDFGDKIVKPGVQITVWIVTRPQAVDVVEMNSGDPIATRYVTVSLILTVIKTPVDVTVISIMGYLHASLALCRILASIEITAKNVSIVNVAWVRTSKERVKA